MNVGVNLADGRAADMWKLRVIEPARVKRQALSSAVDVATMVLRIDDIIASKKGSPSPPGGGGGHDHSGSPRPNLFSAPAADLVARPRRGAKPSYRTTRTTAPPCGPNRSRAFCVWTS